MRLLGQERQEGHLWRSSAREGPGWFFFFFFVTRLIAVTECLTGIKPKGKKLSKVETVIVESQAAGARSSWSHSISS